MVRRKKTAADISDDALLDAAIASNASLSSDLSSDGGESRREQRPAAHASTDQQLKFQLCDRDGALGLLPELSGRLFYNLVTCMSIVAVPDLNALRKTMHLPQIEWIVSDFQANRLAVRGLVQQHILGNIDSLLRKLDMRHEVQFENILGRRFTKRDKAIIAEWTAHLESDFWIVGHVQDGTVFVQLGPGEEEHVFVVKGLATPMSEVTANLVQEWGNTLPVRTVLLPFRDCITYFSTMAEPLSLKTTSARDLKAMVKRAGGAYARAVQRRCVYRRLDAAMARPVDPDAAVKPVTPYTRGLSQDLTNNGISKSAGGDCSTMPQSKSTLKVWQLHWAPYEDLSDPRVADALLRAGQGHFVGEGYKRAVHIMVDVYDSCPCVLCGSSTLFGQCCKAKVLQLQAKAMAEIDGTHSTFVYDPIDEPTGRWLMSVHKRRPEEPLDVWPHVRISPMEVQEVQLSIPRTFVETVCARLNESNLFLTTAPDKKWDYLGYFNLNTPACGLSTFGDITLTSSGVLKTESMSARRTTALISEMRNLTCDMPIAKPTLTSTPSRHAQIEIDKLEQNADLLGEGLGLDVDVSVDKKSFARPKTCAYCDSLETPGKRFQQCGACRAAHYCDASCQKKHWKSHKAECKAAQAAAQTAKKSQSVS